MLPSRFRQFLRLRAWDRGAQQVRRLHPKLHGAAAKSTPPDASTAPAQPAAHVFAHDLREAMGVVESSL